MPFGKHLQHVFVIGAVEIPVGVGPSKRVVELLFSPLVGGGRGDDLLSEDVERSLGNLESVELPFADAAHERRALDELVAGRREEDSLGSRGEKMPRAADSLQEHRERARSSDLTDQIDRTDIDPELERGGRDHRLDDPALQLVLRAKAKPTGEAPVMGQDCLLAEPLFEVVGDPFREPARVDEDQRRSVGIDEIGQAIVDLGPHLVRGHRSELVLRNHDRELHVAAVSDRNDLRRGAQEARHLLDGLHRRRKTDPLRSPARGFGDQTIEPLHREREMGAAFVVGDRVDFVDDHRFDGPEDLPAFLGSQEDVERLRRRHQDVRHRAKHFLPLRGRSVSGAHRRSDRREGDAAPRGEIPDSSEGHFEVLVDVVAERAKRRNVDDTDRVGKLALGGRLHETVDRDQKRRERLPRPRGSGDQNVAAGSDERPTPLLWLGRRAEAVFEPFPDQRMEVPQHRPAIVPLPGRR